MQKKALSQNAGLFVVVIVLATAFFSPFKTCAQTFIPYPLAGHIPSAIARYHLQPVGDVPQTNRLQLALSLPLRNEAALGTLLRQIYDPASPHYHQYLTPEQFTAQFGPSQPNYDAVISFAQSKGLAVTGTSANRLLVDVSGDAATIERAFHVTLHQYQHPVEPRTFFAPDTEPVIDQNVSISHISGLDNFLIPHPAIRINSLSSQGLPGIKNALGSGPFNRYMGNDFRAAYAPGVTLNGTGQTVGLLELEGYYTNDIQTYETSASLPNVPLVNVSVDSFPGVDSTDTNGIIEVSLDIEMVVSMATNVSSVAIFEMQNGLPPVNILNAIAANSSVKQISSSWLLGDNSSYEPIYQTMAAQGQSFFQASGDNGAFYTSAENQEEYADDTNITLVGGTTLHTTGAGGPWSSESAWNWYITLPPNTGATGGGTNYNGFVTPTWQQGVSMTNNQGSTTLRNVPDVAMTADNIDVQAVGTNFYVGGTSCAAPLWAGFTALVNQQAASVGRPDVGFLNPAIYAIGQSANYTNDFHDITTGNNTNSNDSGRYFAVPGYDLCTGWGTPNGQNLINALVLPDPFIISPLAGFSASGYPGGPFSPASQIYTLTNSGAASLNWSLINTSSWLSASITNSALAPGTITNVTISVAAAGLNVGTYSNTLTFTDLTYHVSQSFQFTLQVTEPLAVTPTNGLLANGPVGGPFTSTPGIFLLTNVSSPSLNWKAADNVSWLNLSPTNGTLAGFGTATITASAAPSIAGFPSGIYNAQVAFTDTASGLVQTNLFVLSIGQSIVLNGNFATGDFTDWIVAGTGDSITNGSKITLPPGDSYAAVLGSPSTFATNVQTLTTLPGQRYLLSFLLLNPTHSSFSRFEVLWNTNASPNIIFNQSSVPAITNWTNMTFIVTATGTNTSLEFAAVNSHNFYLDNVNVWPLPVPNVNVLSPVGKTALAFTWNSFTNISYEVQSSTNLLATNWFNLSTNTALGTSLTVTNPIGTNTYLFYRIRELP